MSRSFFRIRSWIVIIDYLLGEHIVRRRLRREVDASRGGLKFPREKMLPNTAKLSSALPSKPLARRRRFGFDRSRLDPLIGLPTMPLRSRALPAGFIAPCLPTSSPQPPSGEVWLHEIKHDGFRVIARGLPVLRAARLTGIVP